MKRVSIFYMLLIVAMTWLCIICCDIFPTIIVLGYVILYMFLLCGFFTIHPKQIQKRMYRFHEEMPENSFYIDTEFFLHEVYVVDMDNGILYGLFSLNPFHIQKFDLAKVDNVEIITKLFMNSVIASIRCRLYIQGKKYNLWLSRDARYEPTITIQGEEGIRAMSYAEEVKEVIETAVKTAKSKRG